MSYIKQVKDSTGKIYDIKASGIDAIKDWAESDPNSPYYIRNRTHYESNGEVIQLDKKYIKDVWDEINNLSDNFENYVTLSNPETIDGDLKVDGKGLFFENIYIGAEIPNNKVVIYEELNEQLENKVDSDKFVLGTEIGATANTFRGDIYLEKVNSEGTYVETISIKDALQATGDLSQYRLKTDLNFYSTDGVIRPAYFDKIYKGNEPNDYNQYIILEELLEQLQDYRTKDDLQYNDTSIALLTDIPEYPDMDNYLQRIAPVALGSFTLESGYLSINNYIVWSSDNQLSFVVDGNTYNVKNYIDERIVWEKGEIEDSIQQVNTGAIAGGIGSVAEGVLTKATAIGAHAEGGATIADGAYSHTEGNNTIAKNTYEHAEGVYNVSHYNQSTYPSADNTIHSIGIGSSKQNRKNAVEVMQNGDVYVIGIGGYDGANIEEAMTVQEIADEKLEDKQNKLNTGEGIQIIEDTISVVGKQDTLTAGENITIENNVISASSSASIQSDWNQKDETSIDFIKNKPFYSEITTIAVPPAKPKEDFEYFDLGEERFYKLSNIPLTKTQLNNIKPNELFISDGEKYIQLSEASEWDWFSVEKDLDSLQSIWAEMEDEDVTLVILNIVQAGENNGITTTEEQIGLYFAIIQTLEETKETIFSPIYKYTHENIHTIDKKFIPEMESFKIYNNPYFSSWKQLINVAEKACCSGKNDTLFNIGDIFDTSYGRVRIIDKDFDARGAILGFAFIDSVIEGKFDAGYSAEGNTYCNNNYKTSQIRAWLNAEEEEWYNEEADYAKFGNLKKNKPLYANKPGFIYNLTKELKPYLIEKEISQMRFLQDPEWNNSLYDIGDKVRLSDGTIYICNMACYGRWPEINACFTEVENIAEYNSSFTYNEGDKVYYNYSIWICNINGTTGQFNYEKFDRDASYDVTTKDKVFLLSATEMNGTGGHLDYRKEGEIPPYYKELFKEPTDAPLSGRACFYRQSTFSYWTRSSFPGSIDDVCIADSEGFLGGFRDTADGCSFLPAFYVNIY